MAERRAYAAHAELVDPARRMPQLWRLLAGLVLMSLIAFALGGLLRSVFSVPVMTATPEATGVARMLYLLASFGLVIPAIAIVLRLLHHRRAGTLIGTPRVALRQAGRVLRALALLGVIVLVLPPYNLGDPLVPNLPLGLWLSLLPLSLAAVLIQVASEELLFRGYLQQQLAARFSHPGIWLVVPSVLFGLGHYSPEMAGENAWLVAVWAMMFGVLMADLTARAGTLGPAIAVHLANNVIAILIIALPDTLSGLSLFLTPFAMTDTSAMRGWLFVDFGFMICGWLAARLAIGR
ncbi:CPBP family intramembrane glutamic endopeptidase [Arenibacterium halophilum]|uniref:CPBP family intramembrane metalloprotease n=1 Tax=Arenibacterium halophilum TaxID=2583821 RepID=A0ABY2XF28_9RHOB|nr:type II CAAX endopeptidase family protein [Arenibacterium halophilum]TMV15639.1 CPBP family intramembrane metalloprotease [Arenibacterium halophilum]